MLRWQLIKSLKLSSNQTLEELVKELKLSNNGGRRDILVGSRSLIHLERGFVKA